MLTVAVCIALNEQFVETKTLLNATIPLLFKNYSFIEVTYQLVRFNKTKFFSLNTKNTDRNDINKQGI